MRGGGGHDGLFGHDGLDQIFGEDGNDYIDGGADDDTIDGGGGNDRISGGGGADMFVISADNNADTITDFTPGADKIDLTAVFTGTFALLERSGD